MSNSEKGKAPEKAAKKAPEKAAKKAPEKAAKKSLKEEIEKKIISEKTLDNLSVEAIDGLGPKITAKFEGIGVKTIEDLTKANPFALYAKVKLPVHRFIEYRKKAQRILLLDFDKEILNSLADKDYTIEKAIEEEPKVIEDITGKNRKTVHDFLENVVEITMYLDAITCRANSVAILHRAKPKPVEPPTEPTVPIEEEIEFLGREQMLAYIHANEIERNILDLLRKRARNKADILSHLEAKEIPCTAHKLNEVLDYFVRAELVQMEWFKGNYDVHLFLISDFALFRSPAEKIVAEAKKGLPTKEVADKYLEEITEYFNTYRPNPGDNILLAEDILNPDVFVTVVLLREQSYPFKKFPKGFGEIDMQTIIKALEMDGLVTIIPDETKRDWVLLKTDISIPQYYPEYMIDNIRADMQEKIIKPEAAIKHLDLLEIHYDTFFEIYSKFLKSE
ncbi:MAG: hypothetical protein HWN66_16735 [Candidatus Helarchaeota archaeon]|nr:hypothetical protein [Candidatus Helarchaeota archaeon]